VPHAHSGSQLALYVMQTGASGIGAQLIVLWCRRRARDVRRRN
jgi:hypothetical protein